MSFYNSAFLSQSPRIFVKYQKFIVLAIGAGLAVTALSKFLRRRRRAVPAKPPHRPISSWKRNRAGFRSPNGGKIFYCI